MTSRWRNIDDLREAARRRAHRIVFDYIDGAADDEAGLRTSRAGFAAYDLVPRVLTGVERADTATTLLGERIATPFILSPSAGNRLFHTEGERAVARAASRAGTIYTLSTLSTVSIEEVAEVCPGPKWFQLYVWRDRGLVKEMLGRAKAAGYRALVLTVDMPITGNRERDLRNGLTIPPKLTARHVRQALAAPWWTLDHLLGPPLRYANLSNATPAASLAAFVSEQLFAGFSWRDAEWLLGEWAGPAVIKGVVSPEDARRAVELGFRGVVVSTHGGRQLAAAQAPIDALPAVAQAIGGSAELILDGGVRCGADVIKALALGARAVSFARPYLYGLAAAGERGVDCALEIIRASLERDMVLLGVPGVADIGPGHLRRRGAAA